MAVGPENVAIVKAQQIRSGPAISGTLAPEEQANVRSEIGGAVLSVSAEQGQRVAKGAVLARIDDANMREAELSARAPSPLRKTPPTSRSVKSSGTKH
jgi:multidrug efflux pump subunit AcrA (membrane-fusion protein)